MAMTINRRAGAMKHEIVDQRIARTGVAGDGEHAVVNISDIGDAADIQQRHLALHAAGGYQRAMKHRHDGRALAARRNIGGAKIIGHVDAKPRRKRRPVADLDR